MRNYNSPFIKSIALNDLPEEAWTYLVGGPIGSEDLKTYYKAIPWLFRGVDIRANTAASVPFVILRGETEIDNSEDYQNALGVLPNPEALIGLIEAALTIWGYAYLFRKSTAFSEKLRYILPSSITPKINAETGEPVFVRTVNGKANEYTPKEIVYFWKSDPFVEAGPPTASPAQAAAGASGVLFNVDLFAKSFFEHGAIKATLLTTKNIVPQERDRLKSWWQRMFSRGSKSSWQTDIVNADAVTPVVVGEGLESLENTDLTESKRVDIAAALGIPYSVLFSNASNRATAEQDDLHLYTKTILPECHFIEAVLNEQVFKPMGYMFKFMPQSMELFQKSETERAESLTKLIEALQSPEEFLLASSILGYDITPDILAKIEASIAEKKAEKERMAEVMAQPAAPAPVREEEREEPPPPPNARSLDLEKWRTKAVRRLKRGDSPACQFASDHIDPVTSSAIYAQLEGAKSENDVKAVFADVFAGYP